MGTVYRARNPSLPRSDALKVLVRRAVPGSTVPGPVQPGGRTRRHAGSPQHRHRLQPRRDRAAASCGSRCSTWRAPTPTPSCATGTMTAGAGRCTSPPRSPRRWTTRTAGSVLHRDIKPANFLLAADDDERVFLADFGIARALDEAVGLTQTGMVDGQRRLRRRRRAWAGADVDHRADIYSLGCSLYRMLTGKSPFAALRRDGRDGRRAPVRAAAAGDRRPTRPAPGDRRGDRQGDGQGSQRPLSDRAANWPRPPPTPSTTPPRRCRVTPRPPGAARLAQLDPPGVAHRPHRPGRADVPVGAVQRIRRPPRCPQARHRHRGRPVPSPPPQYPHHTPPTTPAARNRRVAAGR